MSEIKNGTLGLYGTEYSKCNHLMTLGFKGLTVLAQFVFKACTFNTCRWHGFC